MGFREFHVYVFLMRHQVVVYMTRHYKTTSSVGHVESWCGLSQVFRDQCHQLLLPLLLLPIKGAEVRHAKQVLDALLFFFSTCVSLVTTISVLTVKQFVTETKGLSLKCNASWDRLGREGSTRGE